ncbi:MAG: TM0106 family RecB-like putative nuclease, partial [Vicinamibacterales bacterium]
MQRLNSRLVLSATDLSSFLSCRHRTGLDMAVADRTLARPKVDDPFVDALRKKGLAHETRFVEWLRGQGLSVVDLSNAQDKRAATVEALRSGVDVVVQAALGDERWMGYADILRRVERPSDLGAWSYEAYDTKLARETRAGTILQLALYSELLGQVQGVVPEHFHVVTPEPSAPQMAQIAQMRAGGSTSPERTLATALSVPSLPSVAPSSGLPLLDLVDGPPESVPHTIHAYRFAEYAAYYRMVKAQLLALVEQDSEAIRAAHYPEPVEACEVCRWWDRCNRQRRADDHLAFIAGIARTHRAELVAQQVPTLTAAAEMPVPVPFKPERGSAETYGRLGDQARVQFTQRTSGEACVELLPVQTDEEAAQEGPAGFRKLPAPSPGDMFLDLEGARFAREGGREYLFGLWTSGGYQSWFATTDAEEKAAFEAVMDLIAARLKADPGAHVYHFNHYEPSAFKRLMGRHATRAEEMDALLRSERFVDLYTVVRQGLRAGVESYSIKQLEQYYAFSRDVDLRAVSQHLQAVELALEDGAAAEISAEMRAAVEGYNRDVCRSTAELRDWLETLRAEAMAAGATIPRPEAKPAEASEKVAELQARAQAIRARLLAPLPPEAAVDGHPEHPRWLLAYLLDWHKREENAQWWEHFRLRELPEDDLLDERAAVVGLEFVEHLGNKIGKTGKPTKSVIHRYRYPPQELEVGPGKKLKLHDNKTFGTVVARDALACTLDIEKGPSMADVHPPVAFSTDVITARAQQESVMRIAERLAEADRGEMIGGDGGPKLTAEEVSDGESGAENPGVVVQRTCSLDLLYRRTPRLTAGAFAPLPDESPADFAVRVVTLLDSTALAIQGPPGAGKTYVGARMILELVKAGRKVGVTAGSHKVIRNLLDAVREQADKAGATVRIGQKVGDADDGEESGDAGILELEGNEAPLAAIGGGAIDVLGGTAWMWARPEYAAAVDVLFVDEAGQMSLANALAVSPAAGSLVLLGDPQQLEQPQKGSHPDGVDVSALQHVIGSEKTMSPKRGIFMDRTWRLAPRICDFTSELFYEGQLQPKPGLERQRLSGVGDLDGAGLWWLAVEHDGNRNWSAEEIDAVDRLVGQLLAPGGTWVDEHENQRPLTAADLRIVAPFNAQVNRLAERLAGLGVPVGTVDKFQGQTCAMVIYSMATSRPEDAPRGMEFLYSLNRL